VFNCNKIWLWTLIVFMNINSRSVDYWPPAKRCGIYRPNFEGVCLSVCNTITFESFDTASSFSTHTVYLHGIRVKFVYKGHRVKVKVTRAKKVRKSLFPQCKTLSGNNSRSIKKEPWSLRAAYWFLICELNGVTVIFVTWQEVTTRWMHAFAGGRP